MTELKLSIRKKNPIQICDLEEMIHLGARLLISRPFKMDICI